MHQLTLVLFTVFIQAAAGLLLCFGLTRLGAATERGSLEAGERGTQILLWSLLIVGMGASFIHLGKPVNAFNVFRGLGSGSPLSMEVACAVLFACSCLLYTLLTWKNASQKSQNMALILAMLLGVALSFAVARVYTLATIPVWDSGWTYAQFFMSVAALGITGMLLVTARVQTLSAPARKIWNIAAFVILLGLIVCTAGNLVWVAASVGHGEMPLIWLPILRLLFQCAAIGMLIIATRKDSRSVTGLYGGIFACIIVSELAGRIFFYGLQQVSGGLQIYAY